MAKAGRIRLVMLALLVAGSAAPASALTKEQAIAKCRESIGRPYVMSCIRGGGSREACRARIKPKIHACAVSALNAANGRANVPVALPTQQAPSKEIEKAAAALPATYVAPPRTITDITAILDSEKPDAAKIAKRKAEADAAPPAKASRAALAHFYYDRGNARSSLGRLREALADAEKAVEVARGALAAHQIARLQQYHRTQY